MKQKTFFLSLGLIAAVLAVVAAVILLRPSWTVHNVTVKVLLPKADAKLVINGREVKGEGAERTQQITTRDDAIVVAASWQANQDRTLVRTTRIDLTDSPSDVFADLRKPDPERPDETVFTLKVLVPHDDAKVW